MPLDPRQQQLHGVGIKVTQIDDGHQVVAAAQADGHGRGRADAAQLPTGRRQRPPLGGLRLAEPDCAT
ncbi:hypothetical protein D3C73_1582230 [compost metagenome]